MGLEPMTIRLKCLMRDHHIPYKEERFINPFIVKRTNSSALQGCCFQDWLRSQIQQHVYYGLFIVSTSKCFRL